MKFANAIDCDLSTGVCPLCKKPGKPTVHRNCPVKMGHPVGGPGTELNAIFKSLSVKPRNGCDCNRVMAWMDCIGPKGCRQRRCEILAKLEANYSLYSWADKIKAAAIALLKGLPLSLEGLLDEAIRRADANTRHQD